MMLIHKLLDTLRDDLRDLKPRDRAAAAARMLGRPELVANIEFRQEFGTWRRGVNL